jgi:beta-lactamase class A
MARNSQRATARLSEYLVNGFDMETSGLESQLGPGVRIILTSCGITFAMRTLPAGLIGLLVIASVSAAQSQPAATQSAMQSYKLDYTTPVDPALQAKLEAIDTDLRARFDIKPDQTQLGLLDLEHLKLAMIHPDQCEYAASVAKIGILIAYFQLHSEAAEHLDPATKHKLGLMIKASSNEMASKFSHELGLKRIQKVLDEDGFYDAAHGGGIWVGKHYGAGTERYLDPVGQNSHAATVRQLLRFYLLMEQHKLISAAASKTMLEIFESPGIPHDDIKFVKALKDRPGMHILRKWGSWENWLHDTAVITAPGRHYILVALTENPKGDEYLEALAKRVDDLMKNAK